VKKVLLPFLIIFFGLFLIYPLSILLSGAFFIEAEGGTRTFSLQYFQVIFENPFYRECFQNSLVIAVLTTIACLLIAVPLAYFFLRCQFPGKLILSTLLLVPLILPPFVGAIGLKQFFARFGSLNLLLSEFGLVDLQNPPDWFGSGGFIGIILLQVLHLYPIMYLSVQAALANLDPSLRDAARNLGAGGWRIFRCRPQPGSRRLADFPKRHLPTRSAGHLCRVVHCLRGRLHRSGGSLDVRFPDHRPQPDL